VRHKYASEFQEELARQQSGDVSAARDIIKFSNKVVEEVGFDKIRKKLAELQELKIVLLDRLCVAGVLAHAASPHELAEACKEIEQTCPKITELDLSYNLLENWVDIANICRQLKRLKTLKLMLVILYVYEKYADGWQRKSSGSSPGRSDIRRYHDTTPG
jgi:hypothetical protein